jgi:hypothetical protein
MDSISFAARTPELRKIEQDLRARRTDREVLNDIESRTVRIETRIASALKSMGLNPDGSMKRGIVSAGVDPKFLTEPQH